MRKVLALSFTLIVSVPPAIAQEAQTLKERLSIPVIGVIEPGARAAVERTRGHVGVIATEGTVKSSAYTKAIHAIDPNVEVMETPAPLFVPLAEEGWGDTHVARDTACFRRQADGAADQADAVDGEGVAQHAQWADG